MSALIRRQFRRMLQADASAADVESARCLRAAFPTPRDRSIHSALQISTITSVIQSTWIHFSTSWNHIHLSFIIIIHMERKFSTILEWRGLFPKGFLANREACISLGNFSATCKILFGVPKIRWILVMLMGFLRITLRRNWSQHCGAFSGFSTVNRWLFLSFNKNIMTVSVYSKLKMGR